MNKRYLSPFLLCLLLVVLAFALAASAAADPAVSPTGRPAATFVQNQGQFPDEVAFRAQGSGHVTWLTADSLWLALIDREQEPAQSTAVRLRFAGAGSDVRLEPFDRQAMITSYFGPRGQFPAVPVWGGVRYLDATPAGALTITGQDGRLWLEAAAPFTLELEGATIVAVQDGTVELETVLGRQTLTLPAVSQAWTLRGTDPAGATVTETIAATTPQSISRAAYVPAGGGLQLAYSTYLGGELLDRPYTLDLDAENNVYLSGHTESLVFPGTPGLLNPLHGVDVYVAKFLPDGSDIAYLTWVNPNPDQPDDEDYGYDIAVDADGHAYVTGTTRSPVFCEFLGSPPGFDTTYNDNGDAMILKFTTDGTALIFCTYVGGNDADIANGIVVDSAGNAIITGGTWSTDFPVTPGAYSEELSGLRDVFVAGFDADGLNQLFGTFVGGAAGQEDATGLAIDAAGNLYAAGWTNSDDFPATPGAFQADYLGIFDAFVLKLNADVSDLLYATYLGGTTEDRVWDLAVDGAGRAHLTGQTLSEDFPTTAGAYDESHNGSYDAFLTIMNASGSGLDYSTFIGGSNIDVARGLTIGSGGLTTLTGDTDSPDFPLAGAYDDTLDGGIDAFIASLNPAGSTLTFSTYLGGSIWDYGQAIATNAQGCLYVTGRALSPDFPTTAGAYDETHNGDYDIFLASFTEDGQPCSENYPVYLPLMLRQTTQ